MLEHEQGTLLLERWEKVFVYDRSVQEWFDRVRITGVVGRLVQYPEGRYAAYDIKGLARTPAGDMMQPEYPWMVGFLLICTKRSNMSVLPS
eukprot:35343-Amphidinium_carterae.1